MNKLSSWASAPGRNTLVLLFTAGLIFGQPQIHFSDLDSGPNTGGQNNQGAFVSIYGTRFGATQGSSSITVGGQAVAGYPVWTNTKVTFQLGPAAASGEIKINTPSGISNGVPFTVRTGNIYFVALTGSDTASGSFSAPWRTVQKAVSTIAAGDTIYVMNGVAESRAGSSDGSVTLYYNNGAAGRPKAIIGYPGAVATIGTVGSVPCASTSCTEGLKATYPSSYWTIANMRLLGNNYGIALKGTDYRVVGNEFTCPQGNGATACLEGTQSLRVKVYGNNVHDVGFAGASALYHGIYFSTDTNYIDIGWNTVTNIKGCRGIQTHSSRADASSGLNQYAIDIHDNFIKDTQCDGIVLATIDPSKGPVRVFNNVIINGGRGPLVPEGGGNYSCIYVAGYTNNGPQGSGLVEIDHNTMVNCGGSAPFGNGGVTYARRATTVNVRMRNNIFYQTNSVPYIVNYDAPAGMSGTGNLFYGNGAPPTNLNLTGSLNVDPKFVNAAGGDYHLLAGSPAIGAGTDTPVDLDKDALLRGARPDIGAYQYAAASANPAPVPQPALLSLSPAAVTASGTVGSNPAAQTVTLSNVAGASTSAWTASSNQPWVKVTPASGNVAGGATQTLSLTYETAGLAAGNHSAAISFTGGSTPPTLQVQLSLAAAVSAPDLSLTPATFATRYTTGGTAPSAQMVTLRNDGGSTAAWRATPAQAWLSVSPASGSLAAGASVTVAVNVTPGSLAAASYTGTVNVTGGSTARSITCNLTVAAAAPAPAPSPAPVAQPTTLTASPSVLGFVGVAGKPTRTRTIAITNTGAASANWAAVSGRAWLRITPANGTLAPGASALVVVETVTTGLTAGVYSGSIVVTGGSSPRTITVQMALASVQAELRGSPANGEVRAVAWMLPRQRRSLLTPAWT